MEEILGSLAVPCIVCFVIGIILFIVEMFTPGFGASGVLGLCCFIAIFVMQLVGNDIVGALLVCAVLLVILAAMLVLFVHSFQSGKLSKSKIVLQENIESSSTPLEEASYQELIGKEGIAITPLRPAGIVEIEGNRVNVQTDGSFIDANQKVTVVSVENLRIIVK